MSDRRKRQTHRRTVDWSKIVHPSLRVSNHGSVEIKPKTLSSGYILYGYDVLEACRRKKLSDKR
jgi:hypothetical protein